MGNCQTSWLKSGSLKGTCCLNDDGPYPRNLRDSRVGLTQRRLSGNAISSERGQSGHQVVYSVTEAITATQRMAATCRLSCVLPCATCSQFHLTSRTAFREATSSIEREPRRPFTGTASPRGSAGRGPLPV